MSKACGKQTSHKVKEYIYSFFKKNTGAYKKALTSLNVTDVTGV